MSAMLHAALAYAARGWAVFPLVPFTKSPFRGSHGRDDGTTCPVRITEHWSRYPRANIGISTGAESGIWIFDVDGPIGAQSLAGLEASHSGLSTLTAFSARGGIHFYFRVPPDRLVGNRSQMLPKIDARGEGGFVVAPPSVFEGKRYRWSVIPKPIELAPAWLLELVAPSGPPPVRSPRSSTIRSEDSRSKYLSSAVSREINTLLATGEGARNDRVNAAAFSLGQLAHQGLARAGVESELLDAALNIGLTEREALKAINSGWNAGMKKPRHRPMQRPTQHAPQQQGDAR